MGNRVAKSKTLKSIKNKSNSALVKAQRADGSRLFHNNLRCALLVTENYYIAKIPSKRFFTIVLIGLKVNLLTSAKRNKHYLPLFFVIIVAEQFFYFINNLLQGRNKKSHDKFGEMA